MDITKKAKEELENRLDKLESLIAKKGIGSSTLQKAQKKQRDVNLIVLSVGVVLITSLYFWMKKSDKKE